jgi:hypothetical protein
MTSDKFLAAVENTAFRGEQYDVIIAVFFPSSEIVFMFTMKTS